MSHIVHAAGSSVRLLDDSVLKVVYLASLSSAMMLSNKISQRKRSQADRITKVEISYKFFFHILRNISIYLLFSLLTFDFKNSPDRIMEV